MVLFIKESKKPGSSSSNTTGKPSTFSLRISPLKPGSRSISLVPGSRLDTSSGTSGLEFTLTVRSIASLEFSSEGQAKEISSIIRGRDVPITHPLSQLTPSDPLPQQIFILHNLEESVTDDISPISKKRTEIKNGADRLNISKSGTERRRGSYANFYYINYINYFIYLHILLLMLNIDILV